MILSKKKCPYCNGAGLVMSMIHPDAPQPILKKENIQKPIPVNKKEKKQKTLSSDIDKSLM